jgi:hypothetical protein
VIALRHPQVFPFHLWALPVAGFRLLCAALPGAHNGPPHGVAASAYPFDLPDTTASIRCDPRCAARPWRGRFSALLAKPS